MNVCVRVVVENGYHYNGLKCYIKGSAGINGME